MGQPGEDRTRSPEHLLVFVLGDVPARWRTRARIGHFVPLLPSEAAAAMDDGEVSPTQHEDDELLRLAARGASPSTLSRELGLSIRTVHRRLARLRDEFGAATNAQLAAELSSRGFGT